MRHLLLSGPLSHGQSVQLTGDIYHHLARVRRVQVGDRIPVRDQSGTRFIAIVQRITRRRGGVVTAIITADHAADALPGRGAGARRRLHLLQAVARGPAMDSAMRQATELGVHSIVPFVAAHSPPVAPGRVLRWQRLVHAASQQSGAPPPQVGAPVAFAGMVERWGATGGVVCAIDAGLPLVAAPLPAPEVVDVALVVGPEGDLSPEELGELTTCGFVAVSLGPHILRVDTAVVSALAAAWQWLQLGGSQRI